MKTREFLEKYDDSEIEEMMNNGLLNKQIEAMRAMGRTDGQIGEQLAKRWSDEKMDKVIASRASAKVYDQLEDAEYQFKHGSRSNPIYKVEQEAKIAELKRRLATLDAQCKVDVKDSGVICKLVVPDKVVAPSNIQIPDGVVGTIGNPALDDLAKILNATSMTPDEFEGFIDKAANQMSVERALEIVPTSVALTEIGFKTKQSAFESLGWVGVNEGWQIELTAYQDWFGRWNLSGAGKSLRTILCYEVNLPDEAMRGKTVAKVLHIWRTAYGTKAPVPDCLSLGVVYEEHKEAMRRLDPGMPHLYVDGFLFRATVKWLRRTLYAKEENDYLLLSFSDGLLRLRFNDYVLGCPARGIWTDDCQVSMKNLLTIEPWNLRGASIRVQRSNECVTFNWHSVRVI